MTQRVQSVSDADFDEKVKCHDGLVLVDFWAPWCSPCRMLAPLIEEIAADFAGDVRVVKVNADDNQQTAEASAVRGLPTVILYDRGVEVDRLVGAVGKSRLAAILDKRLEA